MRAARQDGTRQDAHGTRHAASELPMIRWMRPHAHADRRGAAQGSAGTRTVMQDVHEVNPRIEDETSPIEPLFCVLDPVRQGPPIKGPARLVASVGAWLVERFAQVPGPVFVEDGRLAAVWQESQRPTADAAG